MWPFGRKKEKAGDAAENEQKTKTLILPEDHFTILKGMPREDSGMDDAPIIMVINTPYVGFEHRDVFQWVLEIKVFVREEEGGGLPSVAEAAILHEFEDAIRDAINLNDEKPNAVYVLHETDRDLRTIFFVVYDPEVANNALQKMLDEKRFALPWQFRMEADQDWKAMEFHFKKYIEAIQNGHLH